MLLHHVLVVGWRWSRGLLLLENRGQPLFLDVDVLVEHGSVQALESVQVLAEHAFMTVQFFEHAAVAAEGVDAVHEGGELVALV